MGLGKYGPGIEIDVPVSAACMNADFIRSKQKQATEVGQQAVMVCDVSVMCC